LAVQAQLHHGANQHLVTKQETNTKHLTNSLLDVATVNKGVSIWVEVLKKALSCSLFFLKE
jgi:hypothetical protein